MKEEEIDKLLEESRNLRINSLAERLLSEVDRTEDSLQNFSWQLEEELNESLYVSLDMLGWNLELLEPDMRNLLGDLDLLLAWFEEHEEYECCRGVQEARERLVGKIGFFLDRIHSGDKPTDLIGL